MTNLAKAIVETYTHTTELYMQTSNTEGSADGWKHVDTLKWHAERKLKREIQDLEFWIPRQAEREAKAKYWAQTFRREYTGDEISTTKLEASIAKWKAEQFGLQVMQAELAAAREALKEMSGERYTSVTDKADVELPEDIASAFAEMEAMGKQDLAQAG